MVNIWQKISLYFTFALLQYFISQFLLQISDASGSMKTTVVAQTSPFKQEMLSPNECYILDNGVDKNVFVWKGVSQCARTHLVPDISLKST